MTHNRTDNSLGHQIPDTVKFPDGIEAVISHIKGNGLQFGIYTARGPHTCQGFAASCLHELQDAAYYASIGVNFLKDDSCGSCAVHAADEGDVQTDYERMQLSIDAVGGNMSLFFEGLPDITVVYTGDFGNGRRVGHDIEANWPSMISLVDTGAGLWPYAHTDTGSGSFWSWLDFLQVGSGFFSPTTSNGTDQGSISAVAHMSIFAAMKSVLFLGNRLDTLTAETVEILANPEVIAVNQDRLGVQAQRVATSPPTNKSIVLDQLTGMPLLVKCDAQDPAQQWRYTPNSQTPLLAIAPCNASDSAQLWSGILGSAVGSVMQNKATGQCLDQAAGLEYDAAAAPCLAGSATQDFWLDPESSHMRLGQSPHCLDVFDFKGPNVFVGSCKPAGSNDGNQRFSYSASSGQVQALGGSNGEPVGWCLSLLPVEGGRLSVPASAGPFQGTNGLPDVCLNLAGSIEGQTIIVPCNVSDGNAGRGDTVTLHPVPSAQASVSGLDSLTKGNYTISASHSALGWNTQFGASGPIPHSRWLAGWHGSPAFTFDPSAAGGSPVAAVDDAVIDDDNVGHVTASGGFCLGAAAGGFLEVWAGPLAGGSFAVVLLNRSPQDDDITVEWASLPPARAPDDLDRAVSEGRAVLLGRPKAGYGASSMFAVRDLWAHEDLGTFTGSYTAHVKALGGAMLVVTPVNA